MATGWFRESKRHSLASQGIKTGRLSQQQNNFNIIAKIHTEDFDDIKKCEMKYNKLYKNPYAKNQIKFKSNLVNDDNYSYCGHFDTGTAEEEDKIVLKRVIDGKKGFGYFATFIEYEKEDNNLKSLHQLAKRYKNIEVSPIIQEDKDRVSFVVARKGTLKDNYDLKTLAEDYKEKGLPEISEDIIKKANKKLIDYKNDWDFQEKNSKVEAWETGLILGYPIESTMQKMYGVSFHRK